MLPVIFCKKSLKTCHQSSKQLQPIRMLPVIFCKKSLKTSCQSHVCLTSSSTASEWTKSRWIPNKTSNDAGLLRMRRDQLQSKEAKCIQLNAGFSLKSSHAIHLSAQYHRTARSKALHWKASTTGQPGQKLYTGRLVPLDS